MFILRIKVKVSPEKLTEFEKAMNDLIMEQMKNSDYTGSLYRSTTLDHVFFYQEEWSSRKQLDMHMTTDWFRAVFGCIKLLGESWDSEIIHPKQTEKIL
jgi:quinol monooxygenase YgiN